MPDLDLANHPHSCRCPACRAGYCPCGEPLPANDGRGWCGSPACPVHGDHAALERAKARTDRRLAELRRWRPA